MTRPARLLPFVFNSRDALVLVFEAFGLRFVQNGAQILDTGVPVAVATPYSADDLEALQYVQSGDVVTVVHPNHPPYELRRTSNTSWTFAAITFGAAIAAPTGLASAAASTTAGDHDLTGWKYVVTAIDAVTGEESLASAAHLVNPVIAAFRAVHLIWTPSTGAGSYRIYRRPPDVAGTIVGSFGFVGVSETFGFSDFGNDPDFAQSSPIEKLPFAGGGNYPSVVAYWQQRRVFANTNNNPDVVFASQTGLPANFNLSVPLADSDAVTFRLQSETVDAIRHIISLSKLVVLTEGAEWIVEGDASAGVMTPAAVNAHVASTNGVNAIRPIKADNRMLFLQALGATMRELESTVSVGIDAFQGRDVGIYSTHLFDGHTIVDMAWQQELSHVAWLVRDDGVLLGLSYIPEQDLLAWHRHDTDGVVENVCVVPEAGEHRVYIIVSRVVGGVTLRYLERIAKPFRNPVAPFAWFLDCAVEYDGTPVSSVSGLDHLEGRDVAVYAYAKVVDGVSDDLGHVLANPLDASLALLTVTGGAIELGADYFRVVVGLPYVADVETLDIDTPSGPSAKTQKMMVNRVGLLVDNTRNVWAGGSPPTDDDVDPLENLDPLVLSTDTDIAALVTDYVEVNTRGSWNTNGRMFLRSIDPTPMTVLSVVPQGFLPSGTV